jgi:hypothetical protein
MEDSNKITSLEQRVKRLENVHIWGVGIVLVGLVIFFIANKTKSTPNLASGGDFSGDLGGSVPSSTPTVSV